MKKTYIPLLALALTACQEGNITPDIAATGEMTFKVLAPGAVTKVTGNSFDAMDQIGLYVTDYVDDTTPMPLQISGNRANNLTVTFDGLAWTPEKAIYWKLTIEFGRMYEKMQREWCDYCIKELEEFRRLKTSRDYGNTRDKTTEEEGQ